MNTEKIEKLLDSMTVEDLCGQLLNYNIAPATPLEELEGLFRRTRPGGVFFGGNTDPARIAAVTALVNRYTKAPVIVSADIENGPGCCIKDAPYIPYPMSWGAADDEALIERAGRITAEMCRKAGVHWSFAPVVDINYNKDNPVTNVRAISDKPEQVAKMAGAYVRGMQRDGLMVAGCKHFPGDGMYERNHHF
ncbi:MAG: glycoside hydrolase family 3 protein [Clostridia bacterium]|nr:glycoside hydrolase family 3 protein [Clostridia bacterium]